MRRWLERIFRRDLFLVALSLGFILLLSWLVHLAEPRRIVKWDEVLRAGAPP